MAKVYFKAVDSYSKTDEISKAGRRLLKLLVETEKMKLEKEMPLKVHFGEKGNITYIGADNFDGIVDYIEEKGTAAYYTDTNVLYRGERTTEKKHRELAHRHGFTRLPVRIADGDHGDDFVEIGIDKKHYRSCKIGRLVAEAPQVLVISHFKGHILAGFGGAIKQLGMGCAARGGKMAMHHTSKPKISRWKCKKCGKCARSCPVDAIEKRKGKYVIDRDKCIGCASCVAVCPVGAVKVSFFAMNFFRSFYERLAEYAYAAQYRKKNIYVNFVFNITRGCDCMGRKMKPFLADLGVLASTDPVALDQACLDLIDRREGRKRFGGRYTLEYGEKIGLGSRKYELVKV